MYKCKSCQETDLWDDGTGKELCSSCHIKECIKIEKQSKIKDKVRLKVADYMLEELSKNRSRGVYFYDDVVAGEFILICNYELKKQPSDLEPVVAARVAFPYDEKSQIPFADEIAIVKPNQSDVWFRSRSAGYTETLLNKEGEQIAPPYMMITSKRGDYPYRTWKGRHEEKPPIEEMYKAETEA